MSYGKRKFQTTIVVIIKDAVTVGMDWYLIKSPVRKNVNWTKSVLEFPTVTIAALLIGVSFASGKI